MLRPWGRDRLSGSSDTLKTQRIGKSTVNRSRMAQVWSSAWRRQLTRPRCGLLTRTLAAGAIPSVIAVIVSSYCSSKDAVARAMRLVTRVMISSRKNMITANAAPTPYSCCPLTSR